ncbi:MAG: NUDIX domain-containing protein [Patescibacteria group bacterium]
MTRITIVDENDNPIGAKERDALGADDIYRVAAIWITKPGGDILMAQQAQSKKNDPGKWGPAVAGTIEEGEEYAANALKEAVEEIGLMINPKKLEKGPRIRLHPPGGNLFCQWFTYVTDMPTDVMELNKEEVAQVRWLSRDVVKQMIEKEPKLLVESAPQWIGELLKKSEIPVA